MVIKMAKNAISNSRSVQDNLVPLKYHGYIEFTTVKLSSLEIESYYTEL